MTCSSQLSNSPSDALWSVNRRSTELDSDGRHFSDHGASKLLVRKPRYKVQARWGLELLVAVLMLWIPSLVHSQQGDQLIRLGYESRVTEAMREYFVYLPVGYDQESAKKWPVILFLHGNGQRGNGLDDLDFVLRHGPLTEAWLFRRPLPFVMISPQLPLFGEQEAIEDRKNHPRPKRLDEGVPDRNHGYPSSQVTQRVSAGEGARGAFTSEQISSGEKQLPRGWGSISAEVIGMLDTVLKKFNTDPARVYLTGISLGGFGSFQLASEYPDRFAAMAPVVGAGTAEYARTLSEARIPIWMFGGAKDSVVDPYWLYDTARMLEQAGSPNLRFTMHEDMDHDAWKRVYEGEDLFSWFLRFNSGERPPPEKHGD